MLVSVLVCTSFNLFKKKKQTTTQITGNSKTPLGNCPNFMLQVCDWLIPGTRPSLMAELLELPKLPEGDMFVETNVSVCRHPEHKQTR